MATATATTMTMTTKPLAAGGEVSEVELSETGSPDVGSQSSGSGSGGGRSTAEYSGWVYHLGVNSIGHEYSHLRFLVIRGKSVAMYKREPGAEPGIQPIRKGVVSHTLMVEELGRRIINNGEYYALRFYHRLDQTKKGEIACRSPGEAQKWIEAFEQAKQHADYDLMMRGVSWNRPQNENELNLDAHRPRVRRYARGLGKLVRIGKGPERLLRQSSGLQSHEIVNTNFGGDSGDAFEAHEWRYVRTFNGIRIFEDIANSKGGKGVLLKSVGVVGANPDTVSEVLLSIDKYKRYGWDMLTADLELVETIDGHYDVVYGTYEPKYLNCEGPGAPFPGGAAASLYGRRHRRWRLGEGAAALLPGGVVEALGLGHRPRRCRVDGGPAILFPADAVVDLGLGHRPRRCRVDGGPIVFFLGGGSGLGSLSSLL
ncbi:hypothetical protein GUJ93_ZPchr0010g10277 [Zizania palustris]|uniref:START domain-containing protein n=1 Tax=Zizania palustris TaxID=103762 RepID=A0A8J6BLN4_ZIZPA|nr:hypothetical protein GUJ93_ZPchr0010g10277 [Zizania palustris]